MLLLLALFPAGAQERSSQSLELLFDFRESGKSQIVDRSGAGEPLVIEIESPKSAVLRDGALQIEQRAAVKAKQSAARFTRAVARAGEFTIETWLRPAKLGQEGPARIVTLSRNTTDRLFTLGQDKDRYDVRFRSSRTDANGSPSLSSEPGQVTDQLTHVVYTRSREGRATLYLDGRKVSEHEIGGDLRPWEKGDNYRFAFGDEISGGRPWLGDIHLVALFSRALGSGEVANHFTAGPKATTPPKPPPDLSGDLFEEKVASLLANRCVECHEPGTKEGKLDLTRHSKGFQESGLILPGNAEDSLLWEVVESDEMPQDRDPLSVEEKQLLREWIDGGASWSVAVIDPANYRHSMESGSVWVRRLTLPEYIETVRATTGVEIGEEAAEWLPVDLRADGFSNTAYNLSIDLKHVDAYARLASTIVDRLDVETFVGRFSNRRNVNDKDMIALLKSMGEWVCRGPLTKNEISLYRGITTTVVSAGGDFEEGVGFVLEAMLQSPRFLYRIEKQRGDGTRWPVSDFEMASRLSYAIWGASPDVELFKAAREGRLGSRDQLQAQARRMLEDPRARSQSERFVSDWLHLDRLSQLSPDRERFPDWRPELAGDMQRESQAVFRELVWERQWPLSRFLDAPFTHVTPRLADHYGLPLPPDRTPVDEAKLVRIDLDSQPSRGGLLTQGSVLTIGGDDASMVTRGLFVFHDLLRGTVNNPPPGLDVSPVATKAGMTHRDVAIDRIENDNCGSCHGKFEPLAFGLEKYDGLGTWREQDHHGNRLREDGEILVPGQETATAYDTVTELMSFLAGSDRVAESLTWKLAQFVVGRPLGADDAQLIAEIHEEAAKDGGTYQALLTAIVSSDLVRLARTEKLQ